MPETDVVGGYGQPGAIGLGDPFRHLLPDLGEVARTRRDALLGIFAVVDAHGVRGVRRQHHHAEGAIRRLSERVPLGFLVADGSEEPPVNSTRARCRFEPGAEAREAFGHARLKLAGFLIRKRAGVPRGAQLEPRKSPGGTKCLEEAIDGAEKVLRCVLYHPLNGPALRQSEADFDVRIEVMRERILPCVDECVVRLARIDVLEGIGRGRGGFDPLKIRRHGPLHRLQQMFLRAVRAHGKLRCLQLQRAARAGRALPVDH